MLTARQKEVAKFIRDFHKSNKYPPSIREIADGINVRSTHGIRKHIDALVDKGYAVRIPNAVRGLRITRPIH